MNTYKVVQDSKREEFRKYLEKNGVMDVLTRCLVSLYEEPEKPADALQYVRNTLGAASPDKVELESLRLVVAEMKEKMTVMEEENKELWERLAGLTHNCVVCMWADCHVTVTVTICQMTAMEEENKELRERLAGLTMTVMEEENKELRERLAGLTVDADTADGAEEGDTAAADSTAADAKEKKFLDGNHVNLSFFSVLQ
ncbi:c-Myc-binding protein [Amphibalanus amphitrite]|uniref:c-Myc-binding protein n=1 Tax=Amphibalanus amphitrite TaxID=1232801 RepID=A0A6A4WM63_AMPAM|nr:c-Myc-binding protein [Amphibalanus amphitrite]